MSHAHDVVLNLAAAYPDLGTLRSALGRRDWPACRAVLDAAEPAARTGLIRAGAARDGLEEFLRDVLREDPGDGAAAALLGSHLLHLGWEVRTEAPAEHLTPDQRTAFRHWLTRAEEVLLAGVAHAPADPAIRTALLTSARGLAAGHDEARRRYADLAAIDPHHLPGQRARLQQLCPKWGGSSWTEPHAFARAAMLAVPPGHPHALLVAEAHVEHHLALDYDSGLAYLRSPAVRTDLFEAARRSLGAPDFRRHYGWLEAVNTFAFLFTEMREQAAAAEALRLLGNLGAEDPWRYRYRNAASAIWNARAWALGLA
ncbi:hypothetical protein GCM10010168_08380 [Actinoplanes ianthinogenes]|uniref:DUF4034 domain-containing protein n=1 Tax=Actinoplanes ianthinogenes TaxID=122358 RepID=A0ABM7LT10_9ACTN|nr:hypothetical protein [Actinoplanes ianthinogenes]BCJ42420.1 hypothetical protein Aiant_30770 [Actinoplanes ianthinogenes]GGQ94787.1 hypothetical protein GCM10010168_08380 [Actinoplanes ianthinogenes]